MALHISHMQSVGAYIVVGNVDVQSYHTDRHSCSAPDHTIEMFDSAVTFTSSVSSYSITSVSPSLAQLFALPGT